MAIVATKSRRLGIPIKAISAATQKPIWWQIKGHIGGELMAIVVAKPRWLGTQIKGHIGSKSKANSKHKIDSYYTKKDCDVEELSFIMIFVHL